MSTDVERDLTLLCTPDERDAALADQLRERLLREAATATHARTAPAPRVWRPRRGLALVLLSAGTAAAGVALFASTRVGGPPAASAAAILRQAAGVRLAPDTVSSLTYAVSLTGQGISSTGHITAVVAEDAQGLATRSVQTVSMSKAPGLPEQPWGRYVQLGNDVYGYDAGTSRVFLPAEGDQMPTLVLPNWAFATAPLAQALRRPDVLGSVHAAGRRSLDGTFVDVLSIDGAFGRPALHADVYFDAQTHELRGFDATAAPSYPAPSWHVRLTASQTADAGSLAPDTFVLDAPASAQVAMPPPDKGALASLCGTIARPTAGSSLLEQCQANAPNVTVDTLVAALTAASRNDLASAVAAGQLLPAQAHAAAADQDARLRQLVTTP